MSFSSPLTDAQLRASAIPISGNVGIAGSVAVTGSLTDAQLRATAVPVSGPLTDTQLRATAVPVKQQSAISVSSVLQTTANTVQAAANSLAAAGAGLFHYITCITIQRVNNTATAVVADTTVRQITSANFNGWVHELGSALIAGGCETFIYNFGDIGIRSAVANTLTSFSYPAGGAGTKIRMTITYYTGT